MVLDQPFSHDQLRFGQRLRHLLITSRWQRWLFPTYASFLT